MSIIRILFLVSVAAVIMEGGAWAAKGNGGSSGSTASYNDARGPGRQEMLIDLSVHYVRDTKPDGGTDTATRFSLGGMFNDWMGLDFQGLYEIHAKNYLIGGDFRFVPVDWVFVKGGFGGYASKDTHSLSLTPLAGAGILARINREYYFVTEASYFTVNDRNNVSFGVGFGLSF